MISLTTIQCPKCTKVFITKIVIRQTLVGGRPMLQLPGTNCNGGATEDMPEGTCGFDWRTLEVESFDIPINQNVQQKLVGV
jgi:hypothetical protein